MGIHFLLIVRITLSAMIIFSAYTVLHEVNFGIIRYCQIYLVKIIIMVLSSPFVAHFALQQQCRLLSCLIQV